jgi:hypothetical protein
MTDIAARYVEKKPDSVMALLRPFLLDPLSSHQRYSKQQILEIFERLARSATDVIDGRWCVLGLRRLLPLYDSAQDEPEYGFSLTPLISFLPRDVVTYSPFLQFIQLEDFLGAFHRTKNIDALLRYEKEFPTARARLYPPQAVAPTTGARGLRISRSPVVP